MIIVRFKETFRERACEWALSAALLAWGLLCLCSPDLFHHSLFYRPLLHITTQAVWGWVTFLIGAVRLIFLVINGAWRPSAHIRAIGAAFGAMVWVTLLVNALGLDWLTPAASLYTALLVLDLLSLWFASGDAKLADISAKKKLGA